MDLLTWGRRPWGEWILTHISWDLLWASLFAGVAFLVAHASYMAHGRAGVALVGLVMAHVYFAVRPGEVVDYEVDAAWMDHAAAVSRTSRPAALDRALTWI